MKVDTFLYEMCQTERSVCLVQCSKTNHANKNRVVVMHTFCYVYTHEDILFPTVCIHVERQVWYLLTP